MKRLAALPDLRRRARSTPRVVRLALFMIPLALRAEEPSAPYMLTDGERPRIQTSEIQEASGLAVSSRNDGFLWVINDSGAKPEIHLIERDGAYRGKVMVETATNVDWEDLGSFALDGRRYLLVADTGDNAGKRESCMLYVVREPELPAEGQSLKGSSRVAWKIRFRYDGGPRDCEAVAVDAKSGKILLLSKRDETPQLYELPLKPTSSQPVRIARRIGQAKTVAAAESPIPFANQPTGMDLAVDGSVAAVVTYYGVFLFPRDPQEPWADAFARNPVPLACHRLGQAESVAFTKDGGTILVTSEGRGAKIAGYRKTASPAAP